jgi:hypothetical protein
LKRKTHPSSTLKWLLSLSVETKDQHMCNQFAFLTSKQEKIPVLRPKRQPLEERDRFPGRFKGETGKTGVNH